MKLELRRIIVNSVNSNGLGKALDVENMKDIQRKFDYSNVSEIEVTLNQLLIQVYNYYVPWSRIEGEYSQVRETWIKDAMKMRDSRMVGERGEIVGGA